MNLSEWCARIIRVCYYLLFILVPLALTPWNYELFEFNKMMTTYTLSVVVLIAWSLKSIADKEIRITKTPLDIPIILFVASQFLSSLFSIDRHVSWFGYYSRFNGGMWSIVSYVILYYGFVTNFAETIRQEDSKTVRINPNSLLPSYHLTVLPLLYFALGTALIVSLYGIAQSFGIDKTIWVQDVQNRVFSTLGQPNWLAAYLVALIPVAIYFSWRSVARYYDSKKLQWVQLLTPESLIWYVTIVLLFWALLQTRSRSGYIGFVVADGVFFTLLGIRYIRSRLSTIFTRWTIFIHVLFFVFVFSIGTKVEIVDSWLTYRGLANRFNPTQNEELIQKAPAPPSAETKLMDVGISESTDIRSHVWKAALTAWGSGIKNMLVGTGTETFAFTFYQYRPKEHNMTSEWDFLYNKAHNEYLNYLATTGILGLGSYIFLLGMFSIQFIKSQITNPNDHQGMKNFNKNPEPSWDLDIEIWTLKTALFAGWVSILVTNFAGFSVVIMQLLLFLFPAIIFLLEVQSPASPAGGSKPEARTLSLPTSPSFQTGATLSVVVVSIILLGNLAFGWWADVLFARGYRTNRSEDFATAEPLLSLAASLRPGEPLYQDELSTALAGRTNTALGQKDMVQAEELAVRAIAASDRAVAASPSNVNFWKTRTKLFYSLSAYDPKLLATAIAALERGMALSPNDVKIMYNLAILYGRAGDIDKAISTLKNGIDVKQDYRDLYNGLYVMYEETGNTGDARAILEEYLQKVDPGDAEFKKILSELQTKSTSPADRKKDQESEYWP